MRINKHDNSILKILGDFIMAMIVGMLGLIALAGMIGAVWNIVRG